MSERCFLCNGKKDWGFICEDCGTKGLNGLFDSEQEESE